jgi:hypothetical protein
LGLSRAHHPVRAASNAHLLSRPRTLGGEAHVGVIVIGPVQQLQASRRAARVAAYPALVGQRRSRAVAAGENAVAGENAMAPEIATTPGGLFHVRSLRSAYGRGA